MAFEKQHELPQTSTELSCIHLRSKAMYVTGKMRPVTDEDEGGSQHCWCNITQHVIGPDKKDVDRETCGPSRECYRISR